jgi:Tfp pilus assembly protein PilF
MKRWQWLAMSLLLSGCAAAPVATPPRVFQDALFAPPSEPIRSEDIFAVSGAMRAYLRDEIAAELAGKGRQRGLFDALYSKGQLKLEYDAAVTRNAAEAFAARAGNCLSLVIMTAALAKELGLEVVYQRVSGDDAWSRSGDVYFASAHVNVTLSRGRHDPRVRSDERQRLTIDFIPPKPNEVPRTWDLEESTVVAMYFNNRAAEAFARGQLDNAYWWVREAIRTDPAYESAYNTLGVIYKQRGHLAQAEEVLREVLARAPENLNAMQNLALVYQEQGRESEADRLGDRLERMQPHPPFHFFNQGMDAMKAGDFLAARAMFRREVERDPNYHEFHYWLAAAHLRLGEVELARKHLALALEHSATRGDHDLYAGKLARLNGRR